MSALTDYLDALDNYAGGWNLASTSGVDPDETANGNDGTVSIGTGTRGDTAIEAGGTLSMHFDGASGSVLIADDVAIQNIFANGGSIVGLFNGDDIGQFSQGMLVSKGTPWYLSFITESGSTCKLNFLAGFTTTAGQWRTTNNIITYGTNYGFVLTYSNATTTNNPILYLYDIDGASASTLTVGSGLTEVASPSGSGLTDVASALRFGNSVFSIHTFDGRMSVMRLYSDVLTSGEVDDIFALLSPAPVNVSITSVTATATADANAPGVTMTTNSVTATATASAGEPLISTSTLRLIGSVTAEAAAVANEPGTDLTLSSVTATATAAANNPAPTLSFAPPAATATATAIVPTIISIGPGADQPIPGPPPEVIYVDTEKQVYAQFLNSDGEFYTPATITFKTRAPDGTDTSYVHGVSGSVLQHAIGVYALTFTVDSAGEWTVAAKGEDADAVGQVKFDVLASVFG